MGIKKVGVMTSGGDAPGMNAAIRAVVRSSHYYHIECFGILEGYKGLINSWIEPLGPRDVGNIIHRGGTILKTARSKEFTTKEGRKKAYENIKKHNLDALVIIGGDGSFTGAMVFEKEYNVPIIGIPGTIDNDISGTDFTIGYDTALNVAIDAIDKIKDTATSHNRLFFVEVMGRSSGFIALHSGIATGALDILIPEETNYKLEDLFDSIEKGGRAGKTSSIIVVAEGNQLKGLEEENSQILNDNTYILAQKTQERYPNYDIRVSILGHIQRGGNPTCSDRVLASCLGVEAIEALMRGEKGVMVGMKGNKTHLSSFKEVLSKKNEISEKLIKISDIIAI